jgi:hypothetical protein
MNISIDISEQRLKRILTHLAKNPKTKGMAIELFEIYNFLLSEISQRDMDNFQMGYMYNDLRDGTIKKFHQNKYIRGLMEANKEMTKLLKSN